MSEGVILLVDDSSDDVFLIQEAFKRAGVAHPMKIARDGVEAVAYLSGEGHYENRDANPLPELILLDLKMPRMDGYEVLKWIRSQRELAAIPVIVLTTSEEIRQVNAAYSLGANSFLTKPGDLENLKALAGTVSHYWQKFVRLPECARLPREGKPENG